MARFAMYLALCASCGRNENLAAASFPDVFKFTIINSSLEGAKHLKLKVPFVVVSSPIISAFHKSVLIFTLVATPTVVNNN